MPTPTNRMRRVAPALLAAALLAASLAPVAGAKPKSKPAGLRVVAADGTSLAQGTQFTTPTTIRTRKDADCFGAGTGGSGAKIDLPGFTALGQLADGPAAFPKLDPVRVTDAFSFGLGLCGIGRSVAPPTGFWYLKVNHVGSTTGADQASVSKRDDVLWYLIEDYNEPTPDELSLRVRPDTAGEEANAKVVSYADDGTGSPAVGATVSGASAPTDANGETTVILGDGITRYRASRSGSIPSGSVAICTEKAAKCPAGYARTVGGTKKADSITGTAEAESIFAGPGDDRVDARRGRGRDRINCGPGRDRLTVTRGTASRWRSCERVRFRG